MSDKIRKHKNQLADQSEYDSFKNSIPEDEIWTYQIEGLQPPHIGKEFKNAALKKTVVIIVLLVAISLSIYLSVRAVHSDTFSFSDLGDGSYELIKFSNPGNITELTVDYVNGDTEKPITVLHEYAFNCDEKITEIRLGKDIREIDGKTFYTCNSLKAIYVDKDNAYYCDLDGVLYNKDCTQLICYPIDHDLYLREKSGYEKQYWPEDAEYDQAYIDRINTYVVPDTVTVIGKLAFNYSELFYVYLPEGLETLETMAFFRNWHLCGIYSYSGREISENGIPCGIVQLSLPDSLQFIGSDCFNSAIEMDYMYIPKNVSYIGHHAFWGAARKENGNLIGLYEIHAALDKEVFQGSVYTGDQWTGQYDNGAFPKNVPVLYGESRRSLP